MKIILVLLAFFLGIPVAYSQAENQIELLIDGLLEGNEEELKLMIEGFNELLDNPIIFKDISREKLSVIPFLSATQTEALVICKDTAIEVPSWPEIFSLLEVSQQQRDILPNLILLSDSIRQYQKYRPPIRVNLMLSYWQNIEKAKGYGNTVDEPAFVGPSYGSRMRCQILSRDFSIKTISESDPGEYDFRKPDHISTGFAVHPKRQPFRLFFGDYQLTLGQGLGIGTRPGFRSWKTDPHFQLRRSQGLSLHGGADENRFLRGGAIMVQSKSLAGRFFFSAKNLDATIRENDNNMGFISGVYSSGLHRSTNEMLKKGSVYEEIAGMEIDYAGRRLELGALFMMINLSEEFQIPEQGDGKQISNDYRKEASRYSIWFRRSLGKGMLVGELAGSSTGGSAFSTTFSSFFNKGLAYLVSFERIESSFFSHYTLAGASLIKSEGKQMGRMNILYQPRRSWGAQVEFQLNSTMNPVLEKTDVIDYHLKARLYQKFELWQGETWMQASQNKFMASLRLKGSHPSETFNWQGEIGMSSNSFLNVFDSPGTYLSLRGKYMSRNESLRIQAGLSLFTRNNGTGVFYIYEPDVLYGMSLPALSGSGSRTFFLLQYNFLKSFRVELKLSRLDYDDRNEIGTGNDRILTNHRTSFKVQLVYRRR